MLNYGNQGGMHFIDMDIVHIQNKPPDTLQTPPPSAHAGTWIPTDPLWWCGSAMQGWPGNDVDEHHEIVGVEVDDAVLAGEHVQDELVDGVGGAAAAPAASTA